MGRTRTVLEGDNVILIKKCVFYVGVAVIEGSLQPKQYGYRVMVGHTRKWKKPLYWEWRGRIVHGWQPKYKEMHVNGGVYR